MDTIYFIFVQAIGLLGMFVDIYASLHKNDSRLKKMAGAGSLIFSLHYFLLGAIPGALSELMNGTRTVLSAYTQSRILAFSFLITYTVILFTVPDSLINALPFISSLSITTGLYFYQGIAMRFFYLLGWALWLVYSISVLSIGGIALFMVLLVTTSATIIRLSRDSKML